MIRRTMKDLGVIPDVLAEPPKELLKVRRKFLAAAKSLLTFYFIFRYASITIWKSRREKHIRPRS